MVVFDITFDDNPHGIYFAGQMLSGKVTIQSDKGKQVKGISLKFIGFADVGWTENTTTTINDGKTTRTVTTSTRFYGHEDYFSSLTYLLGSNNSGSNVLIEPGIHSYSFACNLPVNCPSSFEGAYGHIRYMIKVALIRPWKFDQTYTKGFTVLKVMNLNYDSPLLRVPVSTEVQKTFCCGPCRSEPLKLHVSVPQSGYVPGQMIPVSVLVTNDSRVPVQEMKVELCMLVNFHSQFPYRTTKDSRVVVAKLKGDSVMRQCKKLFTYNIKVPSTPPTCFNACSIIQIAYVIVVEAKVKGVHRNHVLTLPVTIGNVPLLNVVSQQPRSNNYGAVGFTPAQTYQPDSDQAAASTSAKARMFMENGDAVDLSNDGLPTFSAASNMESPWAADASIAPPSYEEAVHVPRSKMNAGEEHDYNQTDFAPRYPVFNVPPPTAPTMEEIESGLSNATPAPLENTDPNKTTWL